MSEREFTPAPTDERNEVARLKEQLAKAETAANEAEAFGKYDVSVPNVGEDTYESYLNSRPENGVIRDGDGFRNTENGRFTNAQEYNIDKNNDNNAPQSTADYYHDLMESDSKPYEEQDFSSLGLKQLVFEMAKAEKLGDKALSMEVQDAMSNRLTDLAEKEGWTSKQKDEQADLLLNQVLKLSSGEKATPSEDAKVDTLEGLVVSPVPGEQIPAIDTLEGVVVSPIDGEQAPEADADSSAEDSDSEKEDSDPESGDDELDEEKQSIWNKMKGRTKDLYLKAGALFSTTLYTAGNFMPTPKQNFLKNESIDQFEARVKRYGAYKIIGAVGLILAAKYGLPLLSGGEAHAAGSGSGLDKHIADQIPSGSGGGGSGAELFSADAHTVTRGEGWYKTFEEMKITNATEQANLLQKVGPELQARGWAYPMENGSWGISHTGQLPDDVLKLIKNSR